jgi:hypothetical protein
MKTIYTLLFSLLIILSPSCSGEGEKTGQGDGGKKNKNGTSKIDRGQRLNYIVGDWALKDVSFEDVDPEKEEAQNQIILQALNQASMTYNEDKTLVIRLGPGEEYTGTYKLSECGSKLIEVLHVPDGNGNISKVESPSDIIELSDDKMVLYDKEYKTIMTFSKK